MLKALEMVGFKSFADKTRFEFPEGITVVVGPNGSGKSNIVDAIKWVLGEQSAKSLRGKDMSDVIFKGNTGAGGRRAANAAEATIILDNSQRHFEFDSDEIHVGRRVYRSGESEYLINGQPSRLKDIRNMFRGTGVGTDAYSLIEQGKVERMLQASPKDRRAIFEEAAGISRFNAKKVEAQRRLARVEDHLIRLADIVEEVGSRYRSIKSQASKAARYKEYTTRLKELRTHVGATDWRIFQESLETLSQEKTEHEKKSSEAQAAIDSRESENQEIEQKLESLNSGVTEKQELLANVREQIANHQSEIKNHESRVEDIGVRDERFRLNLDKLAGRITELVMSKDEFVSRLSSAQSEKLESENTLKQNQGVLESIQENLKNKSERLETNRKKHSELIALVAELEKQIGVTQTQKKTTEENEVRIQGSIAKLNSTSEELNKTCAETKKAIEELNRQADEKDSDLAEARRELETTQKSFDDLREKQNKESTQRAASAQRLKMIRELEKNLEGIQSGPRALLQEAKKKDSSPYNEVVGLVADLVQVNVQHASLIDIALGAYTQYIVVDGENLIRAISDEKIRFSGRIGFIQLHSPQPLGDAPNENLKGINGVIGRMDQLVQTQPEHETFVKTLLRGTWLVKRLSDALHLRQTRESKARFVTLDGEVIESDGTIIAGPKNVATGIVSRRSELRALTREIDQLDQAQETRKAELEKLESEIKERKNLVQQLLDENAELSGVVREKDLLLTNTQQRLEEITEQLTSANSEFETTSTSKQELVDKLAADSEHLSKNQTSIQSLATQLDQDERDITKLSGELAELDKSMTQLKVELARSTQLVEQLNSESASVESQLGELQLSQRQSRSELAGILWSRRASLRSIGDNTLQLEQLATKRDALDTELQSVAGERSEMEQRRKSFRSELDVHRKALKAASEKLHEINVEQEKLNLNREQLRQRLFDDYGIEVAELEKPATDEELQQREEIDNEIKELRRKISNIGSVNMDALKELEETEARYNELHGQYTDLVEAKDELEKIIQKINNDSRRLFTETLGAIRTNFQQLFRSTFGGGRADIVLEEGVDVLEAGIDIVATPPGKTEFNNSLLSGGEKALTAVSLLMAIFKFRPSPFCILDEVDAPFDEANIGRFLDVLKSFLGWTKFVIVTHSKKTMTAADTLYGVTMQESGVSKRVSVRFEEVSEDGEISQSAVDRANQEQADSDQGAA